MTKAAKQPQRISKWYIEVSKWCNESVSIVSVMVVNELCGGAHNLEASQAVFSLPTASFSSESYVRHMKSQAQANLWFCDESPPLRSGPQQTHAVGFQRTTYSLS